MEKLILRGVMYGADKIPDQWFEKVPGGYYKAKQDGDEQVRKDKADSRSNGKSGGNWSRPSSGYSGSGRSRRYSTGETMRPPRDKYDDGYRSDRRRGDRRERSSYDGPDDDEDYYSGDDRYRRRRHQGGEDRQRRRSYDNYDRYGDNDEYGRSQPYDRDNGRRANGRPPYPEAYTQPDQDQYKRPDSGVYAAAATAGGAAAAEAAPYPPNTMRSPPPSSNGAGNGGGYVPYSDIYGPPDQQQTPRHPFSPPPTSSSGSVQPNLMNQVAPPPQHYHQNPYAQEEAAAAAGAAAADATYNGSRSQDPRYEAYDPRYDDRRDDGYDRRYDDRYNGYNETGRPYSRSPPRQRRGRREDVSPPPRDSYGSDRRARSERRPDDPKRAKSQRGKSRIREAFDTSQRGLGYGAVGALAGGLVGSEVGKGPIPTAIAAAIGAIGANAFEARERYADARKPPGASAQTQPLPPPPPWRREAERSAQYEADGTYARRNSRRREGGYISD